MEPSNSVIHQLENIAANPWNDGVPEVGGSADISDSLDNLQKLEQLAMVIHQNNCPNINQFFFKKNDLTDEMLGSICKNCSVLQRLDLSRCKKITDIGLEHLKGLAALQKLDLSRCDEITDRGLKHIGGLTSLQELELRHCAKITDRGIEHLGGLNALQRLDLGRDSNISELRLLALSKRGIIVIRLG